MATPRRGSKTARKTTSSKSSSSRIAAGKTAAGKTASSKTATERNAPRATDAENTGMTELVRDKKESKSRSKSDKKNKRDKVIRDSFTMPAAEYDQIAALKKRCVALGIPMKKSELLRAGIGTLQQMPDERLLSTIARIDTVKTGRPTGKKDTGPK